MQSETKKKKLSIISDEVASALDRTMMSNRKSRHVITAVVKTLGFDDKNIALSKESLRTQRSRQREKITVDIKKSFSPNTPVWDGKQMESLT